MDRRLRPRRGRVRAVRRRRRRARGTTRATGTYSRGAAAWGPYGARGDGQAYNPRTGAYGQTRQGSNVYGSWGTTSVQRGDQWAQTARVTNNRTGNDDARRRRAAAAATAVSHGAGPAAAAAVARTGSGDVYAGRDGNVYRNDGRQLAEGRRERQLGIGRTGRATWTSSNRDSRARAEGQQRTRDYSSYQGGRSSGSSYRGGGGGTAAAAAGGGGGRRR